MDMSKWLYVTGQTLILALSPTVGQALISDKGNNLGALIEFNYRYDNQEARNQDHHFKQRQGRLNLESFRLNYAGQKNHFDYSAEYAWFSGFHTLMHGWIGSEICDNTNLRFGVMQEQLGLMPFAMHNWWFGVPYYMGLGYNFKPGIGVDHHYRDWHASAYIFKNDLWGDNTRARYYYQLYDDATTPTARNRESSQLNLRLAKKHKFNHHTDVDMGLSARLGKAYNVVTERQGHTYAGAIHADFNYRMWNVQLEYMQYGYAVRNVDGVNTDTVMVGAFNGNHTIPSRGTLAVANIAYKFEMGGRYLKSINVYNDFSVLLGTKNTVNTSRIDTLGAYFDMDPMYIYFDIIWGKNMVSIGRPDKAAAIGAAGHEKGTVYNINIGFAV